MLKLILTYILTTSLLFNHVIWQSSAFAEEVSESSKVSIASGVPTTEEIARVAEFNLLIGSEPGPENDKAIEKLISEIENSEKFKDRGVFSSSTLGQVYFGAKDYLSKNVSKKYSNVKNVFNQCQSQYSEFVGTDKNSPEVDIKIYQDRVLGSILQNQVDGLSYNCHGTNTHPLAGNSISDAIALVDQEGQSEHDLYNSLHDNLVIQTLDDTIYGLLHHQAHFGSAGIRPLLKAKEGIEKLVDTLCSEKKEDGERKNKCSGNEKKLIRKLVKENAKKIETLNIQAKDAAEVQIKLNEGIRKLNKGIANFTNKNHYQKVELPKTSSTSMGYSQFTLSPSQQRISEKNDKILDEEYSKYEGDYYNFVATDVGVLLQTDVMRGDAGHGSIANKHQIRSAPHEIVRDDQLGRVQESIDESRKRILEQSRELLKMIRQKRHAHTTKETDDLTRLEDRKENIKKLIQVNPGSLSKVLDQNPDYSSDICLLLVDVARDAKSDKNKDRLWMGAGIAVGVIGVAGLISGVGAGGGAALLKASAGMLAGGAAVSIGSIVHDKGREKQQADLATGHLNSIFSGTGNEGSIKDYQVAAQNAKSHLDSYKVAKWLLPLEVVGIGGIFKGAKALKNFNRLAGSLADAGVNADDFARLRGSIPEGKLGELLGDVSQLDEASKKKFIDALKNGEDGKITEVLDDFKVENAKIGGKNKKSYTKIKEVLGEDVSDENRLIFENLDNPRYVNGLENLKEADPEEFSLLVNRLKNTSSENAQEVLSDISKIKNKDDALSFSSSYKKYFADDIHQERLAFSRTPDEFVAEMENFKHLEGNPNPVADSDLDKLEAEALKDLRETAEDPTNFVAKGNIPHIKEHLELNDALHNELGAELAALGVDRRNGEVLALLHDMGKSVPDDEVLKIAKGWADGKIPNFFDGSLANAKSAKARKAIQNARALFEKHKSLDLALENAVDSQKLIKKYGSVKEAIAALKKQYGTLVKGFKNSSEFSNEIKELAKIQEQRNGTEFLFGRIAWHDQSTIAWMIKKGKKLNIPDKHVDHLIADIIGHNDGSSDEVTKVFWKMVFPGYSKTRRIQGRVLAFNDRFGQASQTGAGKIFGTLNKGDALEKAAVKEAFFTNPGNTIRQLDDIGNQIVDDGLTVFKDSNHYKTSIKTQQDTIDAFKSITWNGNQASVVNKEGKSITASTKKEFTSNEFQEALYKNSNRPTSSVPRADERPFGLPKAAQKHLDDDGIPRYEGKGYKEYNQAVFGEPGGINATAKHFGGLVEDRAVLQKIIEKRDTAKKVSEDLQAQFDNLPQDASDEVYDELLNKMTEAQGRSQFYREMAEYAEKSIKGN